MSKPEEKPLPPRVWLDDSDLKMYAEIEAQFPDEHTGCVPYIPESLSQARERKARREAFEEALLMANARRKRHHNSLSESLKLRIQELAQSEEQT